MVRLGMLWNVSVFSAEGGRDSFVPAGLFRARGEVPSHEWLGYFQGEEIGDSWNSSLRIKWLKCWRTGPPFVSIAWKKLGW